jgi:Spy/CpxP family protein refolding chaperone
LQTLTDVLMAQRKAMAGSGADPRSQLQGLLAGERFDRAAAQSLLDEKTRAVQAGGPAVIAAFGDFYDSLQPAQQQKVRELMQRRRGWMASHG